MKTGESCPKGCKIIDPPKMTEKRGNLTFIEEKKIFLSTLRKYTTVLYQVNQQFVKGGSGKGGTDYLRTKYVGSYQNPS